MMVSVPLLGGLYISHLQNVHLKEVFEWFIFSTDKFLGGVCFVCALITQWFCVLLV